jgi:homogentisate 1,2-dioxygenase
MGSDKESNIQYQAGFGNHFSSEGLAGALPPAQNSPKSVAYGLYAEQLSGSAFTAPRSENLRTWLYRIRPSVVHGPYQPMGHDNFNPVNFACAATSPNPMRWDPFSIPAVEVPTDFIDGLKTVAFNGNAELRQGTAVHIYVANVSMGNRFFYNADGEFLVVPQLGTLEIDTELGQLNVAPGEIAVIPRGLKFRVSVQEPSRGYICENYGMPFRLPTLGLIGSNGLADPRHFLAPVAKFEDRKGAFECVAKFSGNLYVSSLDRSPLDVVAWQGNYVPYKYHLDLFQVFGTTSWDHPDPSIFTVLTSGSEFPGTANVDFVLFPPRWMVAEHTFRPPYFHRNVMSEYMGLIRGKYDAKAEGFNPGGGSLHNAMSPHGPDATTHEKAVQASETPYKINDTLAFMFESRFVFNVTDSAKKSASFQKNYLACWSGLKSQFRPNGEGN